MNSMYSRATILSCEDRGEVKEARLDLSAAYPMLRSWIRTLRMEGKTLTVEDEIDADLSVTVTYPLHTLSLPMGEGNCVRVERDGVSLLIEPVGNALTLDRITDRYAVELNEGVPAEFAVSMPQQYHIYYRTQKAKSHRLTVKYTVKA